MKILITTLLLFITFGSTAGEYRQIIIDEGVRFHVYVGPNGHLHAGVGHFLDEESCDCQIGDKVDRSTVSRWFRTDYLYAKLVAEEFVPNSPREIRDIITNMAFNMGKPTLFSFVKLRKALIEERWFDAAHEMQESKWYDQVGYRSKRLVNRMLSFGRLQSYVPQARNRSGIDSGGQTGEPERTGGGRELLKHNSGAGGGQSGESAGYELYPEHSNGVPVDSSTSNSSTYPEHDRENHLEGFSDNHR